MTKPGISVQGTGDVANPPEDTSAPMSDADVLAAIQAEFANRPAPPPQPKVTITDLYQQLVSLVSASLGYRQVKLRSEATATKLMELTLFWAINNRDREPSHDILPSEDIPTQELGGEAEAADENLVPDEVIEAAADQTDPDTEA